ncbi:MAG TPA: hypothetical protein VFM25_10490 [Verrucomicrobiae bacterium]|jgi:hypothetical protein|nr:hypothetical protein [Verrucomicrobiae bacterium]
MPERAAFIRKSREPPWFVETAHGNWPVLSEAQMKNPIFICRRLLMHWPIFDLRGPLFIDDNDGNRKAAKTTMMAINASSSINVKALAAFLKMNLFTISSTVRRFRFYLPISSAVLTPCSG